MWRESKSAEVGRLICVRHSRRLATLKTEFIQHFLKSVGITGDMHVNLDHAFDKSPYLGHLKSPIVF